MLDKFLSSILPRCIGGDGCQFSQVSLRALWRYVVNKFAVSMI